jgi:adenylate cyclase
MPPSLSALVAISIALAVAVLALVAVAVRMRRRALSLERRLRASVQRLEQLQGAFARFAPQVVVEGIIERSVPTASEKKNVTVLFADLKGFTAMSEKLDPGVLVEILNGYLREMSRAIAAHRGHVSKFIGDGILALFGALKPNPWQVDDAAHAALAMRTALDAYNEQLRRDGHPALAIGVGIHTGTVVAGVIGSAELLEYTVLGSVVNLSARVEGLTRSHGVDILVTEEVRAALDPRFAVRALPAREVKGVSAPVVTFALQGFEASAACDSVPRP